MTEITDNDRFNQKHYITRTLFIIIQIIGKTKSRKNIPFLEQMRHIQQAIVTSKHQRFYNTSNWSGYICLVKNLNTNSAAKAASRLMPNKHWRALNLIRAISHMARFTNGSVKANINLRDSAFKTHQCIMKDKNRDALGYFFR